MHATGPQPVPASVQTAPYHLRSLDDGLQRIAFAGLSRAHRRLFLLIDGFRPTTELIRLMGRSQAEVESLLQDLERAGVIRR
jgi:DNA-binding MarR family transcriptional regulator